MLLPLLLYILLIYKPIYSEPELDALCPEEVASSCPNKLHDNVCEYFFEKPHKMSGIWKIDKNCTKPEYEYLAVQCRRICMTCCNEPSYQCEDRKNSDLNCTEIAKSGGCITTVPWIASMLTRECPRSCGLCKNQKCADKDENCPLLSKICEHKDWYKFMEDMCPRTCNTCHKITGATGFTASLQPIPCYDAAVNCAENRRFCHMTEFNDIMQEKCQKTCNYCDDNKDNSYYCRDLMASCPTWGEKGFCNDPGYTTVLKEHYCRKTCGYCKSK